MRNRITQRIQPCVNHHIELCHAVGCFNGVFASIFRDACHREYTEISEAVILNLAARPCEFVADLELVVIGQKRELQRSAGRDTNGQLIAAVDVDVLVNAAREHFVAVDFSVECDSVLHGITQFLSH